MLKSLMLWIDSWSIHTSPETLTAENSQIQWLRILPFILLHLACLAVFWVGVSWFALGFMLAFYLIRMFSITAFFHRYLSHKTFQTSRPVQFLFVLMGTMSAQRRRSGGRRITVITIAIPIPCKTRIPPRMVFGTATLAGF